MLYEAIEKLSASRGTPHLSVEASDTAREFFAHRGFIAEQRNSVSVGNEWLSNTTMKKKLASKGPNA
jgi:putative acetyltransferase